MDGDTPGPENVDRVVGQLSSLMFNILDASNSIGVTERTAYILRVRQLAVGIAKHYVEDSTGKAVA